MEAINEIKAILEQCSQTLLIDIQRSTVRESQYRKMIESSDNRISSVNGMVNNLITTMNRLTETYIHHIEKSISDRNNVYEQNGKLLQMVEALNNNVQTERNRYESLMQKYIELKNSSIQK